MNNPLDLTPEEFIVAAKTDKVFLIDALVAQMSVIGFSAAKAERDYYRVWLTDKQDARVPGLRANLEMLRTQKSTVEHMLSALQSTLRAERELLREDNADA